MLITLQATSVALTPTKNSRGNERRLAALLLSRGACSWRPSQRLQMANSTVWSNVVRETTRSRATSRAMAAVPWLSQDTSPLT